MEGFFCRFGHRVSLEHNLSSPDRWADKEGQQDIRGHVEDVCDESIVEVGRVSPFSRVRIQQKLSGVTKDESF